MENPKFIKESKMERNELSKKFKKLGWGDDAQSVSIFDFLMSAKEQIPSNAILFDLGAGQCRYAFFFEHCNYITVDFAKCDEKWDFSNLNFIADITKLGFIKNNSVDYCLNTTTLEHVNEPSLFFAEINRILKPGGKLFLYVPFVINEHQKPYDFFRYTSYGLKHLCEKNGLKAVSITPSNGPLYTGIRWAFITLRWAKPDKFFTKLLTKILRHIFKYWLIPIFDRLDVYSKENGFPQCWLLTAEKEGKSPFSDRIYNNKQEVIESMVQCPHCKGELDHSIEACICPNCQKMYPVVSGQIRFLEP